MPDDADAQAAPPAASTAAVQVPLCPDGVADRLAAAALWGAGLVWLAAMMGLQIGLRRFVPPERMQGLERVYTRGQVALTGSRWRAVVDPQLRADRAYLFFQNHVNHLDHCTMYCATPHFKQGVELAAHFRYPIYGAFMRGRGTIPVEPGRRGLQQLIDRIGAELDRGHSVLMFPEGTRTKTGMLGPFQPGSFRIAQRLGAPIVPVTVTGMYRVMRKGSYLIRPGYNVTVYCDTPVETAGTSRADLSDLMDTVFRVMHARLTTYYTTVPPEERWWSRREHRA